MQHRHTRDGDLHTLAGWTAANLSRAKRMPPFDRVSPSGMARRQRQLQEARKRWDSADIDALAAGVSISPASSWTTTEASPSTNGSHGG